MTNEAIIRKAKEREEESRRNTRFLEMLVSLDGLLNLYSTLGLRSPLNRNRRSFVYRMQHR